MKKSQIAAQLFTCYNYMQNYKDIEFACKELSKIGFSAVQFSGAGESLDCCDIKKIYDDYGLVCDSVHADSGEVLKEPERLIDKLNKFDAKYIVFSCPSPEDMLRTENQTKILAKKLENAGKIFAEAGKVLCYHNHNLEFFRVGDGVALDCIYNSTDPKYLQAEPDTYWIAAGGQCPAEWCEKLKGRMPLLHLKDFGMVYRGWEGIQSIITEVGNGNINWKKVIKAAEEGGTLWYIIEQDSWPVSPFDSLKQSFDFLCQNFCEE